MLTDILFIKIFDAIQIFFSAHSLYIFGHLGQLLVDGWG